MKITFVLPGRGLAGGIRVVASYGNMFVDRGDEVTIVCLRTRWPRRPTRVLRRAVGEITTAAGWRRDHLSDFRGRLVRARVADLARVVPDGDAVVATHWLTADPVYQLSPRAGAKYYFLQGYEAHSFDPEKVDATWRLPMPKLTVARWLQALAADKFGDPSAIYVPNGLDPRQFDAPPRDLHKPPTVGVMYSSAPVKGCATALDAVRRARGELHDLGLVCFGASAPTTELPLPENTTFHYRPEQTAIRDIYASADVWLLASETEGFGLPALEAMACRCPVVVTRCGGPADFVEEDVNGYFVDVGDAEAMAAGIVTTVSDPVRWKRLSDAAYATVQERFTIEQAFARFAAVLEQHVDASAQPGTPTSPDTAPLRSRL